MPQIPQEALAAGELQHTGLGNPAELLWNLIIRPPRSRYCPEQLGPRHFRIDRRAFVRRSDARLRNPRGHVLRCSWFEPLSQAAWEASRRLDESTARDPSPPPPFPGRGGASEDGGAGSALFFASSCSTVEQPPVSGPATLEAAAAAAAEVGEAVRQWAGPPGGPALPCVVFLHGNSSCRLEAIPLVPLLLPLSISVFCFDFSGCGLSEGDYISLGWHERDDLAVCMALLRATGRVSAIALWGRSMGAFTALLHADRDPSIAGLVLDSPFTSLALVAEELAHGYARVPTWMVRAVLAVVRNVIRAKAGFDIDDLKAAEHVSRSFSPALFIAAEGDDFVLPHHARELHEAYQGEKELHLVPGDHNSARPEACRRKAALFLCRAFHDPRLDDLLRMHASGLYDIFTVPSTMRSGRGVCAAAAAPPDDGAGDEDFDEEGAGLARRLRVFPSLSRMMLIRRRQCWRPLVARTAVILLQEQSEAGFFLRLEPAPVAGVPTEGVAQFLVFSIAVSAVIVSRVGDGDFLETLSVAPGVPAHTSTPLELRLERSGAVRLVVGAQEGVVVDVGGPTREEATLWLMLLAGQTTFGALAVEDSEATLAESVGDLALQHRHLGPSVS